MSGAVTFLLVDDDDVDRESIKRIFLREKITNEIIEASDGDDALELLHENYPDWAQGRLIILLDLNMPRVSGLEFLRILRQTPGHELTPVFIVTTSSLRSDRYWAEDMFIQGYIVKDELETALLKEVVEQCSLTRVADADGSVRLML